MVNNERARQELIAGKHAGREGMRQETITSHHKSQPLSLAGNFIGRRPYVKTCTLHSPSENWLIQAETVKMVTLLYAYYIPVVYMWPLR